MNSGNRYNDSTGFGDKTLMLHSSGHGISLHNNDFSSIRCDVGSSRFDGNVDVLT